MKNIIALMLLAFAGFLSSTVLAAPPENDHWQNATPLTGASGTMLGANIEATTQFCEPSHYFDESIPRPSIKSVWYSFTPTESASYTFHTNSTTTPVTIAAYRMQAQTCQNQFGIFPSLVTENQYYNQDSSRSRITFRALAGQTVYLKISSSYFNPDDAIFTFGWEKTKLRYFTRLQADQASGDHLVVRRQNGRLVWYGGVDYNYFGSVNPVYTTFGLATDMPLAGDYDGDSITDYVAIRKVNGYLVWYIANKNGYVIDTQYFGLDSDKPKVGDFDGDGVADIAVVRNDTSVLKKVWHILRSSDRQHQQVVFGEIDDAPWVGDYDGDGKSDMVSISTDSGTFKQTWRIRLTTNNSVVTRLYGEKGDIPQSADFDGDGKTDICVFRNDYGDDQEGNWYFMKSSAGMFSQINIFKWGAFGDSPQAMELGYSGKTAFVVYRGGQWWMARSVDPSQNFLLNWGIATDTPMTDLGQQQYYVFN